MQPVDRFDNKWMLSLIEMNTEEFINEISDADIQLSLKGDSLICNAPKGRLSAEMKAELARRKEVIIVKLKEQSPIISASISTASLSKKLDNQHAKSPTQDSMLLKKAPRDQSICLSFSQERLWFLYQLEPQNISYNIFIGARFKGEIRVDLLEASLAEIIQRHESLRTTFVELDGQPIQLISPTPQLEFHVEDFQSISPKGRLDRAHEWIVQEIQRPFDLSKGPLFRAALAHLDSYEYIFMATMHHITADGWSFGIFFKEFGEIYQSLARGEALCLPELPIQYADFAYSQRLWLQSRVIDPHLEYWKSKLANTPVLQLPADRPRAVSQQHIGSRRWFKFPEHLKERVYEFSKDQGVTPFMTLLAVFKVLLHKYSGQRDFAVGTPVANRNSSELEGVFGFFVNTLVLRDEILEEQHFAAFLKSVKETTLDAMAHQDAPFEKVVEAANPDRDMSYSPLFQVMFAFQNFPWSDSRIEGLTISLENIDAGTAMFDLSLYMWEMKNQLEGFLEYDSGMFDDATIERMEGHFKILLGSVVSAPETNISELPILTATERHQILVNWNQTDVNYPKTQCYQQLFAEQAQRTPEATTIICGDAKLSYKELNSRANQVARYLRRLGAGPGNVVGIYVDRTLDMAVGLLGILKAGSAYTPLDPSFPKDRIEYMLEDCNAGLLLTQKELSDNIKDFSGVKVSIDADWNKIAEEDSSDLVIQANSENLAYIIYTSGSTGKPKGVQISHQALNNFLYSMMETPGATPQDTILSVTTMSFDIFGLELFMPLLNGGRVVIAEREDTLDGARLAALVEKHGVTIMQATPSTWRIMLEAGWKGKKGLKILCGGEAFPKDLIDPLLERCDELWNMYGPTETTIWSTIFRIESSKTPVLVGLPIGNTQTYILDQNLHPLPVGLVGELHIGGDGLSHGYLNRPDLTAEKFIPNPFSKDPAALMYKTGDLARYRSDGMIECLGRVDNQVKLRGFRIELGEIEARIKDIESIKNSVVVIREDHPGDKRLVAYYVARENQKVSITDLTGYLRTKLPEYMVPQQFVSLEKIPLTPNGKVDRKALPKPDGTEVLKRNYVPPQSETEIVVSEIWKQVLKIEKPSIQDNFFELGGHSLLLAQVLNKIRQNIVENVPMIVLFQYPTIASLSKYLYGRQTDRTSKGIETRDRAKLREENILRQKRLRKDRGATHG
jgi:amino acid adenylation domain-containing protein